MFDWNEGKSRWNCVDGEGGEEGERKKMRFMWF